MQNNRIILLQLGWFNYRSSVGPLELWRLTEKSNKFGHIRTESKQQNVDKRDKESAIGTVYYSANECQHLQFDFSLFARRTNDWQLSRPRTKCFVRRTASAAAAIMNGANPECWFLIIRQASQTLTSSYRRHFGVGLLSLHWTRVLWPICDSIRFARLSAVSLSIDTALAHYVQMRIY